MSRKKPAAPKVAEDGRVEYRVSDGVSHVNGKAVKTATVRLTPAEALYDVSLGRLVAIVSAPVEGA